MPDPRHLRALLRPPDPQPDADLLARFVADRDADAFTVLVRRHGPMVLSVCRRLLGCAHDADDAFQATFLVLARRAGAVRPRSLLANWLYGVAYRTALEARRAAAVRRAKEQRAAGMRDTVVVPDEPDPDLRELLDRELSALPDVYRAAVVVCDLEGLGRKDAAARLGWSEGTLSGRLSRARSLLAKRLARHGLAVCAGALGTVAGPGAVACLPAGLAESTVRVGVLVAAGEAAVVVAPVAALTEGVMKAMLLTKLKGMATILLVSCAVLVTVAAGWRAEAGATQDRPADKNTTKAPPRKTDKDRIAELERERDRLLKLVAELQDRVTALEADRRKEKGPAIRELPTDPLIPKNQLDHPPTLTPSVVTPTPVAPGISAPPPAVIPGPSPTDIPSIPVTPAPSGSPPRNPDPGSLPPPPAGNSLPALPEPTPAPVIVPPNTVTPPPSGGNPPLNPGSGSLPTTPAGNPPPGPAPADPTLSPQSASPPEPLGAPPRPTIGALPPPGVAAEAAVPVGVTKVYAVEDLASDEKQAVALIKVVQRAVEPNTWDARGGAGVIEYFAVGKALIVRNTADAHKQLGELLTMLREVAGKKTTATGPRDGNN